MSSRLALLILGSFVAGGAAGWWLREPVVTEVVRDGTDVETAQRGVHVARAAPDRSCDEAVAECERARDFYRAQLVVYEGMPQTWPSDVPSAFTEAPLREALANASQGVATVEQLDCAEYPCIALVALTSDDQSCCEQIEERLPDPVRQKTGGARIFQTEDGRMAAALAFGARDRWNDDATTRTRWRMEQMAEEAQDR